MALMRFRARPPPSEQGAKALVDRFHQAYPALKVLDEKLLLARREEIRKALIAAGSVPAAAKLLGIGERTLWTWLRKDPEARKGIELPASRVASKKRT